MTDHRQNAPGAPQGPPAAADTGQGPNGAPGAASPGDRGVCGLCVGPMRFTGDTWVHGLHGEELCAP